MLLSLSGREHSVYSGVAVCGDRLDYRVNVTQVWFGKLSEQDLTAYLATAEPWDKAGGYGIQGRAAMFVQEIHGSYSGIMGLPLFETAALLKEFDYPI